MTATTFFIRLGRWGLAGFSAVGFIATYVQSTAFYAVAGRTAAMQAAFGTSMSTIASRFAALFPPPLHPETVGGYVWWRAYGAIAIVFSVWAVVSATAMVRSDERRGRIEAVLATGTSRPQLIAARAAAFGASVLVASLAVAAGFAAGVLMAGGRLDPRGVGEASVLVLALTLSCYGISLLVGQLTPGRAATAVAGAALLTLFLFNSLSRIFDSFSTLRWLSPYRYYELNQPLVADGIFDSRSVAVLLSIAVITTAAAGAAFMRRDAGSPLLALPSWTRAVSRDPAPNPAWRIPIVRELAGKRVELLGWCCAMVVLPVVFVALTKAMIQPLLTLPTLVPYFGYVVRGSVYPSVLGYVWFNFAELLFAGFAVAQVAHWAADDTDGRLELTLSQPRSRSSVVVERAAAAAVAATLIAGLSGVAVFYASRAQSIDLDPHGVATASLMLVPFAAVFAGAGALLAAWNPRAAVGVLGALTFLGFLDTEVGPLLKFPAWLVDLSPFKLFGTPLVSGLDGRNLGILLAIALAGLASSILANQRRDVGT